MTITRREALKTLGFAAAGLAFGPRALLAEQRATAVSDFLWSNKHQNLSTRVRRHYDVWNRAGGAARPGAPGWRAGFDHLRAILEEAEYKSWRVRAVGSRWSLSPVAISPDVMINTTPLNAMQIGLPADHVSSTSADPSHLVWAQCGATVMELSAALESRGLSLPTSGASNGQTICGAIATGTHGSARRVGSMQDYVLGLHVMVDGGRHFWIERASRPVVSDAFCAELGATLVRDDQIFLAAVVGLGSFGVMHAVLFEAVPIYLLEVHRRVCDWHRIASAACRLETDLLDLPYPGEEPFHFDVMLNPYSTRPGRDCAVITAMYKRPFRPVAARAGHESRLVPGADLLGIAGVLAQAAPQSIPAAADQMFRGMLKAKDRPPLGTHGQVFGATELVGHSLSMELGCCLGDAPAALETLVETARARAYPGMIGLRFVKGSDALLAFTRFDTTCMIEMTGAGGACTADFYDRAWAALSARQIPFTLHWGKVNDTARDNIHARWGGAVDDWISARHKFLSATGRHMFTNDLLTKTGLAEN